MNRRKSNNRIGIRTIFLRKIINIASNYKLEVNNNPYQKKHATFYPPKTKKTKLLKRTTNK